MFKLFKTTDDKLKDIGFKKNTDSCYNVAYERKNTKYGYTQIVVLSHKDSKRHIIQSYDKDLFDSDNIGNICVGLSYYETKLFLKKMKEKGWTTSRKEEQK